MNASQDTVTEIDAAIPPPNLRRLWAIVIGLGVLLIIGMVVMVTMLVVGPVAGTGGSKRGSEVADVRVLDIPVTAGTTISEVLSDGSRLTMVVRGATGDETGDEVIIIDSAKGTIVLRVRLVPK